MSEHEPAPPLPYTRTQLFVLRAIMAVSGGTSADREGVLLQLEADGFAREAAEAALRDCVEAKLVDLREPSVASVIAFPAGGPR